MQRDYSRALEVAVGAARAAGAILRAEFHRAGGPRGTSGNAPADEEAEREIRGRLLGAFPSWGYLGEETGSAPSAPGEDHFWLVDPNDGTTAFQKGYRGSSVSIGLLRDGAPVLGVVFAFAAPDDDGDLIAWAEGSGLVRNGRGVARQGWKADVDTDTVILLARGADFRSTANAAAVAPGRFRAIPSIAYRLALVAAGEGEATVSLHSPGAWDYGAGHALLVASGGTLVDERGRPVGYSREGQSRTGYCFGGGASLVRVLAARDWRAVLSGPRDAGEPYAPQLPRAGESVEEAGVLSRAHGCLLGQLSGDALGSQVEFEDSGWIRRHHPRGVRAMAPSGVWQTQAGQPTDDSELALALARSIVEASGFDAEAAARAYRYWYRSHPFDCGTTTATALGAVGEADVALGRAGRTASAAALPDSQANGSLMRISPLGVWGHRLDPDALAALAEADSALTHPNPVCRAASRALAVAIGRAVGGGGGAVEVYAFLRRWAEAGGIGEPAVAGAIRAAADAPPGDFLSSPGWVLIALQNALFRLLHEPTVEEAVAATIAEGGDTDTNAAVAGALAGAVHGRDAIPLGWREAVLSCRPDRAAPGTGRPRPRAFWPTDALVLAERLAWLGARPGASGPQRVM